jgi:hypothetical protein
MNISSISARKEISNHQADTSSAPDAGLEFSPCSATVQDITGEAVTRYLGEFEERFTALTSVELNGSSVAPVTVPPSENTPFVENSQDGAELNGNIQSIRKTLGSGASLAYQFLQRSQRPGEGNPATQEELGDAMTTLNKALDDYSAVHPRTP